MKQIASFDSYQHSRPQSMLLDFSNSGKDASGFDNLTSEALHGKSSRMRSQSNQNISSCAQSNGAQPHTCSGSTAPSTNQLHVSPTTSINSVVSVSPASSCRPKLITQVSPAGACEADSPSPVERDGVWSATVGKNYNSSTQHLNVKVLEPNARIKSENGSTEHFAANESSKKSPSHLQKPFLRDKEYLGASLHSTIPLRNKSPYHSLSNPEFPLATRVRICPSERTHSYDDLYSKRRLPPFHASTDDKVSPSREKINSLTSQIYSSLDQSWAMTLSSCATGSYHHILGETGTNSGSNPICEVLQKIIKVTTPLLNFNQAHIQTLMEVFDTCNQSRHHDYKSIGSHSSLSVSDGDPVYDSPVAYLLSLGYKLIDKPLNVLFGVPYEGFMTLTFKLAGDSLQTRDALLKVRGYY